MQLKAVKTEALWLLSCYALVFVLYGFVAGSWRFWQSTLDIQMHNTYFVISNAQMTVPFFVLAALVVTSARAIAAPLRTPYTWVVLVVLGLVMVLLVGFGMLVVSRSMQYIENNPPR